jgi:hypothetical protein
VVVWRGPPEVVAAVGGVLDAVVGLDVGSPNAVVGGADEAGSVSGFVVDGGTIVVAGTVVGGKLTVVVSYSTSAATEAVTFPLSVVIETRPV